MPYEQTFTGVAYYTEELVKGYTAEAFTEAKIRADLSDPSVHYLLLGSAAESIGYAKLIEQDPPSCVKHRSIYLERVYIVNGFQGQGFGGQLMDAIYDEARQRAYKWLWLSVWEHNVAAIKFYEHLGFEIAGEWEWQFSSLGQSYIDRDLIMLIRL